MTDEYRSYLYRQIAAIDPTKAVGAVANGDLEEIYYGLLNNGKQLPNTLKSLQVAIGNRDFSPINMVFWGTSMTEGGPGVAASIGPNNGWRRWLNKVQNQLRSRFPLNDKNIVGSTGFIPPFYKSFNAGGTKTLIAGDANNVAPSGVTYSGNLTGYGSGLGNRAVGLSTASDWIQFTFTGDAFDLFLSTHTTASTVCSVSVDGGAAVNKTLPATTLTPDKYSITGLTTGTHTVKVSWVSTGPVVVTGLMPYNGDVNNGIRLWDAGRGSAKITDVGTLNGVGFKHLGLINPYLVGIEWGYNEYFGNVASAAFKANLQSFVAACQANVSASTIFLFINWPKPTHPSTPIEPWSNYVQAIKDVASATANSIILDLSQSLPDSSDTSLGILYDGVHFNDKGSGHVADLITSFFVKGIA